MLYNEFELVKKSDIHAENIIYSNDNFKRLKFKGVLYKKREWLLHYKPKNLEMSDSLFLSIANSGYSDGLTGEYHPRSQRYYNQPYEIGLRLALIKQSRRQHAWKV